MLDKLDNYFTKKEIEEFRTLEEQTQNELNEASKNLKNDDDSELKFEIDKELYEFIFNEQDTLEVH